MPTPTKLFEPSIVRGAAGLGLPQARPADPGPQPGDVRGPGRQRAGHPAVRGQPGQRRRAGRDLVHRPGGAVAVVHGAVRQLRRGHGRGPRQGPGRRAAQDPARHHGQAAARRRRHRGRAGLPAPGRRPGDGRRRRGHPRRRRGGRGHRLGRRVGHHRRVGPGHPRGRRGPLGRHRRDQGAVGLDPGADHRRAGQELPRQDDRPGRGGRAAEDAQRDRPVDPAQRAHHHLPDRGRDPAAVRRLLRRSRPTWSC